MEENESPYCKACGACGESECCSPMYCSQAKDGEYCEGYIKDLRFGYLMNEFLMDLVGKDPQYQEEIRLEWNLLYDLVYKDTERAILKDIPKPATTVRKFCIDFNRKDADGLYGAEIYAKDYTHCEEIFKTLPPYIREVAMNFSVRGILEEEIFIEEMDMDEMLEFQVDQTVENIEYLFWFMQKDLISTREMEKLKEALIRNEKYEMLSELNKI